MPRPGQIQFSIYPPSKEFIEEWQEEAKKKGVSTSNYIIEMVEKGRRSEEGIARSDFSRENSDLKEELRKLKDELRLKSLVLDKYESELYRSRFSGFSEVDSEDATEYDIELVRLLRNGGTHNSYEILQALKIDPKDSAVVKLVANQLEELRRFGLARETSSGWRWIE